MSDASLGGISIGVIGATCKEVEKTGREKIFKDE